MKMLLLFTVIPLAAAFAIALLRKIRNISEGVVISASLALLACACSLAHLARAGRVLIYSPGGWMPPFGISLVADGLSAFMLVTVHLVVVSVALYSIRYMKKYTDTWKFYSLLMLMLAGMNGVIISGDMFNLYVFMEIASIAGYALVAFGTEPEDLEASFRYAVMGSLASIFILLGIGLLYSYASTVNMADLAQVLSTRPKGLLVNFVAALFLAGFGLKSAMVPFHAWLPDAHSSAPSPVSATLSGVFIKAVGVYALARIFFNVLGISQNILFLMMALGLVSMAIGALLAIAQTDIKRMFAYSSISQVGYIIFALGIASPLAIAGALFHLFNHALFKSLLFLNAGAIEHSTGTRSLSRLGGLNSRLPVTGATSLIGSMSIAGIPPLGGFWSKLIIIVAAVQAGYLGFALIAALVSIITLAYYLKFQTFTFFGPLDASHREVKEAPVTMKLSMVMLAVLCAAAALMLLPALRPYLQSAADALTNGSGYRAILF